VTQPLSKVVVALDVGEPERAFRLVDELGDEIQCYKIGPVLHTLSGVAAIQFLHRKGKRIFLDLKLHDTPEVVADTVRQMGDLGVHFATVHCSGGRRMLEAAGRGCRGSQLRLVGVTVLTSLAQGETPRTTVREMVDLASESRLAGVLCSGRDVRELRGTTLPGFILVAAGIRLPGEEVFQDDQVHVTSPGEALAWGADLLVVGRPIIRAREPRQALSRLFRTP